ncbi:MAG: DUF3540 domain-containing protein [Thermodesulfobacteriota bacterium]
MINSQANLLPFQSGENSSIKTGEVLSYKNNIADILISGEKIKAKKAFSCFLEPMHKDTVLCTCDEKGIYYILGILERKAEKSINISFPSNTEINSDNGNINVNSKNSVSFLSKRINFFSDSCLYKSKEATVAFDKVTAKGDEIQAYYKRIKTAADLISTISKHVMDKFKTYIRSSKSDMVRSEQIIRKSEGLYSVESNHTLMKSNESTKIDGEKILMG